MAKSKMFKDAQKFLDTRYYTLFLENEVLAVMKQEDENPFLLVTYEPSIFEGFILSFAVNFNHVHEAIDVTLNLQDFGPIVLEETFFINNKGLILFGEEAEMHNNPLFKMETDNKVH